MVAQVVRYVATAVIAFLTGNGLAACAGVHLI